MQRSLIPIILASLGFTLFVASNAMPLFDWKIDVIVSDFPHTYSVQINLPPWITTRLGESLEKSSHIFREIKVSDGENVCTNIESFGLNIARSSQEKFLESISLLITPWFSLGGFIEIVLSGVYIWWVMLSVEHGSISNAIVPTMIGVGLLVVVCLLVTMMAPFDPIGVMPFTPEHTCTGKLAFHASLSKIHYETLTIMLAGIISELGSLGIMLHKAIIPSKSPR